MSVEGHRKFRPGIARCEGCRFEVTRIQTNTKRAIQRQILDTYSLGFDHRFVGSDPSVANINDAMGMLRDVVLVSDENDGIALRVQAPKQAHNFVAGCG